MAEDSSTDSEVDLSGNSEDAASTSGSVRGLSVNAISILRRAFQDSPALGIPVALPKAGPREQVEMPLIPSEWASLRIPSNIDCFLRRKIR